MFTVNMFQVQKTGSNSLLDQDNIYILLGFQNNLVFFGPVLVFQLIAGWLFLLRLILVSFCCGFFPLDSCFDCCFLSPTFFLLIRGVVCQLFQFVSLWNSFGSFDFFFGFVVNVGFVILFGLSLLAGSGLLIGCLNCNLRVVCLLVDACGSFGTATSRLLFVVGCLFLLLMVVV